MSQLLVDTGAGRSESKSAANPVDSFFENVVRPPANIVGGNSMKSKMFPLLALVALLAAMFISSSCGSSQKSCRVCGTAAVSTFQYSALPPTSRYGPSAGRTPLPRPATIAAYAGWIPRPGKRFLLLHPHRATSPALDVKQMASACLEALVPTATSADLSAGNAVPPAPTT